MTSKSPGLTLLEAHNFNRWAAKNPDQLLSILNVNCRLDRGKNRGRKLVPWVSDRGKKPVPFEEYIPLFSPWDSMDVKSWNTKKIKNKIELT